MPESDREVLEPPLHNLLLPSSGGEDMMLDVCLQTTYFVDRLFLQSLYGCLCSVKALHASRQCSPRGGRSGTLREVFRRFECRRYNRVSVRGRACMSFVPRIFFRSTEVP
jgi:hypothetical protein